MLGSCRRKANAEPRVEPWGPNVSKRLNRHAHTFDLWEFQCCGMAVRMLSPG